MIEMIVDPGLEMNFDFSEIPDPVSYTHLDVYKRQHRGRRRARSGSAIGPPARPGNSVGSDPTTKVMGKDFTSPVLSLIHI